MQMISVMHILRLLSRGTSGSRDFSRKGSNAMGCNRVIIVRDTAFNLWEEEKFGVIILQSSGFEVEFWNVGPVFQPMGNRVTVDPPKTVSPRNYFTLGEFEDSCRQLTENDLLIFICGYAASRMQSHLRMWQVASKSAARMAAVAQGGMPRVQSIFRVQNSGVFLRKVCGFPYWAIAEIDRYTQGKILRSVVRKFLRLRPLDYIWAGTMIASVNPLLVSSNTRITCIHNFDYDRILDIDSNPSKDSTVALYIDHMGYNHPDAFSLGYATDALDDSAYSRELEIAFSKIEERYGVIVEIAAHPRAVVGSLQNFYPGRKIHHHQTLERAKIAKVLLVNYPSTVVGAAAAFGVSILGLTSPTFPEDFERNVNAISRELKFPVVGINEDEINWPELVVNEEAYERYVTTYLKLPGTSRLRFWEEVSSQIRNTSS